MVKKKRQSEVHNDGSSTDSSDERPLQSPTAASGGCQHVKKSVDTGKLRKTLKATGLANDCVQCVKGAASPQSAAADDMAGFGFEYDNTLWLCLKCGTQLCGRSKNQHALQHFKTPHSDSHALTMNTRSFEIWCYECDNEVSANSRKNLLECVETVRKIAQKPPPSPPPPPSQPNDQTAVGAVTGGGGAVAAVGASATVLSNSVNNIEGKILATWEAIRPLVPAESTANSTAVPLPPPPPPPIPGMAKRVTDSKLPSSYSPLAGLPLAPSDASMAAPSNVQRPRAMAADVAAALGQLPRVRGLTNLGNTCFFNAVMQCLAQTPYLLEVLKESAEPGEEFILPGGTFKFKDDEDVQLPMIKGTLVAWGGLTAALAQALEELQSGGGVFMPGKLFDKLCTKCPQFRGGDQHDSHELLRHLLESVRSEDLKRYQRVILKSLGYKDEDVNSVSEELRQKCKIYGNQAADRILRPEQVFRGFLVSTLTCQECYNVSSRHEYFLDMSLPVSMDKPQPPQRRKTSPDNEPIASFFLNPAPAGPTKAQLKKDKLKERKAKRAAKHHNNKLAQKVNFDELAGASGDSVPTVASAGGCVLRDEAAVFSSSSSSTEESDADVEDNLIDDNVVVKQSSVRSVGATTSATADPNGNNQLVSPSNPEKRGDSPENMDKDSLEEDENDSGIATSPANAGGSFPASSETNGGASSDANSVTTNSRVLAVGLSEKGANLVRQLSLGDSLAKTTPTAGTADAPTTSGLSNGIDGQDATTAVAAQLAEQLHLSDQKAARMKAKRQRTQSYSDWSTTIAPRYQCEDGECSVQSCLNNFTAVELMTGNNKVGCEQCTKRLNGDDPKAKTVNTNATKQFLVSSPPAVLILHLKRFQLGPRCIFRKLTRTVNFPLVLDVAPFCGSKVKNLPNIDRKQKKLLYALYGIVEHSGGMYGGHYTAYVKVRPKLQPNDKRWKFIPQGSKAELDQDDEQRKKLDELLAKEKARELRMKAANDSDDFSNSCTSSSGSSTAGSSSEPEDTPRADAISNAAAGATADADIEAEAGAVGGDAEVAGVQVPMGKWYYVSDSRVQEVNEETVLNAQAYLLFYERIY